MKYITLTLLLLIFSAHKVSAEIFLETIVQLAARDAVTLYDNQLYASNYNSGAVYRINLDGTTAKLLENNTRGPAGIRIDSDNNIYIALYNDGSILKIDADGNESVFAENIREPIALDWDSSNNLYVSHFAGSTSVTRLSPDGTATPFASISQLSAISSLCLDHEDNIYVTSYGNSDIYKVTPAGEISLFATSNLPGYAYLQFDKTNLMFYATVTQTNALVSFDMDGTPTELIRSESGGAVDGPIANASVSSAIGLAISDDGKHVYFATNSHIRRLNIADPAIDQVRPYFTSVNSGNVDEGVEFSHTFEFTDPNNDPLTLSVQDLPSWLMFDGVSQLSGTPSASEAGQSFTALASVTDGFAEVSQAYTVNVEAATPAPTTPTPSNPQPTPSAPENSGGGSIHYWVLVMLLVGLAIRRVKWG